MKIFNIKTITIAMCLTATSVQASTLTLSADSNPNPNVEQYQFTNNPTGTNFSDILNFTVTPNRNLFASISGTDNVLIKFTTFDLYSGSSTGVNSLVAIGEVISPIPQLSFGSLIGMSLAENNYFIKIEGVQQRLSSYNGNVSLFQPSAVPVPAALPLMLSAAGLFGFARRYSNK